MKKFTLIQFILTIFITNSVIAQTATAPSGTGTVGDPYQIATLNNLYWVTQNSAQWNKYFIQTANIDASTTSGWNAGAGFNQIGNSTTRFTGSYDGQGKTISNLFISRFSTNYIGLFGWVNQPAVIKQLGVINANITGGAATGALIGYLSGGGSIIVQKCYSSGVVTGTYASGGLIGGADVGTISLSYSTATVTIPSGVSQAGGFIGENRAIISNCYARGNVSSTPSFTGGGGFAGSNYGGTITNCFSTGTITGTGTKGGFVGAVSGGSSPNSFWNTVTSGQATSAQGTGKTTAEMQMQSTFTTAGWDFVGETTNGTNDYWNIDGVTNSGYAALQYFTLLPVNWLSFTANRQKKEVILQWKTSTEINTLQYTIQYSTDGINFENIGTVAAAGNSTNVKTYSYVHQNPLPVTGYYRLYQTDINGRNSFSSVVKNYSGEETEKDFILGTTTFTNGAINVQLNKNTVINLISFDGKVVYSKSMSKGLHYLNINNISKGYYILQSATQVQKILIQ